jgi:hypothetical protein
MVCNYTPVMLFKKQTNKNWVKLRLDKIEVISELEDDVEEFFQKKKETRKHLELNQNETLVD